MTVPIISFYTINTPYEQEAQAMKESAHAVGLTNVQLFPVESRGSWEANCQIKAEIIQHVAETIGRPFVYVDSDARFERYPQLLTYDWECDLGAHYFKGTELLSGTLWINPTIEVKGLLAEWVRYNQEDPRAWDQRTLDKAIRQSHNLRLLRLPTEYCYIFDLSPKHYGARLPVIVHYQASRKYKRGMK